MITIWGEEEGELNRIITDLKLKGEDEGGREEGLSKIVDLRLKEERKEKKD